jgi:TonB-linked SusC/RagA family outer membrane protein
MGMFNYTSYASNPILGLINSQSANNKSISYSLNAVGFVEVQPIKGLTYRGQISYNQSSWTWRAYLPVYKINDQGDMRTTDQAYNQVGTGWGWNTTNTINYKFDIQDHHFDVLAGTEYSESRPDFGFTLNAQASDAITADLKHAYMSLMKNNTQATVSGYPYGDSRGMSYFGRLNYDYAEKYMFTAIFRADGSSVFAPGHRWGYFPSFSAGWVISNEKFMAKTADWLSFLKLRAGWGQNGNKNIGAFQYEAAFAYDAYSMYSFNNAKDVPTKGASLSRLANEDLTWETSEQLDLGFDARFLGGRLGVVFDWYKKTTKDLLLQVPVSPTTGFSSQLKNAGTVQNTGVEFAINWRDQIGKDFEYNVSYNIAYNKNKVTEVNSSQKYNNGGNDLLAQGTGQMARFEEGEPIGYFWGYKTAGPIQNAADLAAYTASLKDGDAANSLQGSDLKVGDLKFVDVNGDGIITAADKTNLGDPNPDVTMGITLGANYKGFDLNITGYAALGQQVARSYRKFTDGEYENYTTEVFDYWVGEGTSDKFPLLATMNRGVNWQSISDLYIEDAGYFRLQNLTLGYDFNKIWKQSPFQQLRLYVAAQNLFTITKYKGMDPENGMALNGNEPWVTGVDVGNYPQPRTYMVGVNIKF